MDEQQRIDAEWVALNAFRGLAKITTHSDRSRSSYENSLNLGGEMYPQLLGAENSVLRRDRESDLTKEYRQKAAAQSRRDGISVEPLTLVNADIAEYDELIRLEKVGGDDKEQVDKLKLKLAIMNKSRDELDPEKHSENQLIFRDAYNVDRGIKSLSSGRGYRDFELSDNRVLRLRVLHPDKPEHITGADLIYERHDKETEDISLMLVQYKIWEEKKLYLKDDRMQGQLKKMRSFTCENGLCKRGPGKKEYRFPCCAAFLRPTDRLQTANQKFISTGEHLPICKIKECTSKTDRGAKVLEYENIRDVSISNDMFEYLFNRGKIGSRFLDFNEVEKAYKAHMIVAANKRVIVYAQDIDTSQ